MMENWLDRTEYLIGKDNIKKLSHTHIAVFGCGGVGSYAIEALARSGVGHLTLVDHDIVSITNINRQLIADTTTVGRPKVEVCKERLLRINPAIQVDIFQEFFCLDNKDRLVLPAYDYMIDAIDCVSSKICLIETAKQKNIPIISSMGTGNKLDPTLFQVSDISKTSVCPLAKVMRKELRKKGIENLKVVYSKELPQNVAIRENNQETSSLKRVPASISFVPPVAGFILAGEVIKDCIFKVLK